MRRVPTEPTNRARSPGGGGGGGENATSRRGYERVVDCKDGSTWQHLMTVLVNWRPTTGQELSFSPSDLFASFFLFFTR